MELGGAIEERSDSSFHLTFFFVRRVFWSENVVRLAVHFFCSLSFFEMYPTLAFMSSALPNAA